MTHRTSRRPSGLLAAAFFTVALVCPAAAQTPPPARTGAKAGAAARQDGWPRKIRLGESTLVLEAPEAEALEGAKLSAVSSARLEREIGSDSSFGTVSYDADVEIDRPARTVRLVDVRVSKVDFAGMPAGRRDRIGARISQALSHMQPKVSLDDVLASARLAKRRDQAPPKLNTDPPKILFESEPAILVVFDGEPRFRAVEGSHFERAQNTPFLVLRAAGSGEYFLNGGTTWFRASDPKGPWRPALDVPAAALHIAFRDLEEAGVSQNEVKQATEPVDKRIPKILVTTEPAELIVSDGPPQWHTEVAGELESMASSGSDVLRTVADQQYWVVLSGRWYRSGSFEGPWTYVEPDRLPASFRRIPSDSPKAEVLAFVPGTRPAREALVDAAKPRTAAIRRADAHVDVQYDGDPRFEAVPGTQVAYALNTPDQVLKIRDRYYVCDQGVWFTAGEPMGPWKVADSIPDDEIRTIPPESPVYNVRYTYVYDATPETVYVAYTPAYLGSYPYYGSVVFGTGWFYRPWWGASYYPRPWTWGFHARYAAWAGWNYGFSWGPAWAGWRYGFGYGWGARWCGPAGFYRPAYRAAGLARGVAPARSLYASGANRGRAAATQTASGRGMDSANRGTRATQRTTRTDSAKSGQGKKAAPQAGKSKAPKGKAGGARSGRGGGKKRG